MSDNSGRAVIEDGNIVIRVPIVNLPAVVEGCWAADGIDVHLKVTDPEAFAREVVHEINREDEIGTTPFHRMFDGAVNEAFEQGAEGVEEIEDNEP